MCESLLELRYDLEEATARQFHRCRNNADFAAAWERLLMVWNQTHHCNIVDVNKLKNKLDKLRHEYKELLVKFKETGNNIENEGVDSDGEIVFDFKPDVDFSHFNFLPAYWPTMLAVFGTRGGLSGKVLAQSEENETTTINQEHGNDSNEESKQPDVGNDDSSTSSLSSRKRSTHQTNERKKKKSKSNDMAAALKEGFAQIGSLMSGDSATAKGLTEVKEQMSEQTQLLKQLVQSVNALASAINNNK
jgi:hypothetical protein